MQFESADTLALARSQLWSTAASAHLHSTIVMGLRPSTTTKSPAPARVALRGLLDAHADRYFAIHQAEEREYLPHGLPVVGWIQQPIELRW